MSYKGLRTKAATHIKAAKEALATGDMEKYQSEKAAADVIKSQIEGFEALDNLSDGLEVEDTPEPTKTADRLPFDAQDAPEEEEVADVNKSVYVMRYGDMSDAEEVVIKDLHGSTKNYREKLDIQKAAFRHYLLQGFRGMSAEHERIAKTMILLPSQIREDIRTGLSVKAMKATVLQNSVSDTAGVLTPEDYRQEMVKGLAQFNVFRKYARVISTNRDRVEMPYVKGAGDQYSSNVRVTWTEETLTDETVTATNPDFGMIEIPVHDVMASTYVSRNNIADSAFDVVALLIELFGESFGVDEENRFFTGAGGNSPLGILSGRSGSDITPGDNISTVNSGAAATYSYDGLVDLIYSLPQQYRRNARLFGSRTAHSAIRKLKDNENAPLFVNPVTAGEVGTVLGYGVEESESLPAVAANSHSLIYGDLKAYTIVERSGMTITRVDQTEGTAGKNRVAIFAHRRVGGLVTEPYRLKVLKTAS